MSFDPRQLFTFLDEFVVGQKEAKERLATAIYDHFYEVVKDRKSRTKLNVLITGPTGSGKTFLLETVAQILSVHCKQVNSAQLVPAGYEGFHIEKVFSQLLEESNGNLERAEHAIVVLDEIDKRKFRNSAREDLGQMVQQELLKPVVADTIGGVKTNNILFVATGAFVGLTDIVRARLNKNNLNENEALNALLPADFQEFGMIPEFMGRFPIRLHVEKLSRDDYRRLISSQKNSMLAQKREFFEDHGFELHITDGALDAMADCAYEQNLGVRALQSVISDACDEVQLHFAELFKHGKRKIEITEEVINRKGKPRAVFSNKFSPKKAEEMRRRIDELFERIKASSSASGSHAKSGHSAENGAPGHAGNNGQSFPESASQGAGGKPSAFYPSGGASVFTEAERRDLQEILKAFRNPGEKSTTGRFWSWLLSRIPSGASFPGSLGQVQGLRLALAVAVGLFFYAFVSQFGRLGQGANPEDLFQYFTCRYEFNIWHLVGILTGLPVFALVRYQNFSQAFRSALLGYLGLGVYAGIIAFGARAELFSFRHLIFTWLLFLEHALWRPGSVSLWNFLAGAVAIAALFCPVKPTGDKSSWDFGVRVFRQLTGRGPQEDPINTSLPFS